MIEVKRPDGPSSGAAQRRGGFGPAPEAGSGPVPGPVLAIESSCDETGCAILAPDGRVLAERLARQSAHAAHGGVVPEIAARAHLALLPGLVRETLAAAGLAPGGLGAVAASSGPGLIGGLVVGHGFARGLALALGRRFVAVNHLEAHALTARLPDPPDTAPDFPYLLLLISGGHCQCVAVLGAGRHVRLGGTIDDACGEAFDKVAKMLGLGWPGGPALEALARCGRDDAVALPRPLLGRPGCDFSFSGLKTAVRRIVDAEPAGPLAAGRAADIAASFERVVADILADRARAALSMMGATMPGMVPAAIPAPASALVAAGGVAANARIRSALAATAAAHGLRLVAPPPALCTDNAVMVAWAAIERLRAGLPEPDELLSLPRPRWPLESLGRAA